MPYSRIHIFRCLLAVLLLSAFAFGQDAFEDEEDFETEAPNTTVDRFIPLPVRLQGSGFFEGEKLPEGVAESFEAKIVKGLRDCRKAIDVRSFHISVEDIKPLYFAVLNRHPELFFVKNEMNISFHDEKQVEEITPAYTTTNSETIAKRQARIDEVVANALSLIPENATQVEKALILHDYIATHCDYDTTLSKADCGNIYGCLVKRRAVCSGYALAYRFLLKKVGIDSLCVPAEDLMHVWNLVTIDNQEYHVDVTLDDPVFNDKIVRRKHVKHENFLRSDAGIKSTSHLHAEWDYATMTATSTRFDNTFWININEQIPCIDGSAYAFAPDGQLLRYDLATGHPQGMLLTMTDTWYAWNDSRKYYTEKYASVAAFGKCLVFNDHARLFVVDPTDGFSRPLTQEPQSTSAGFLYGLMAENATKLALCLAKDPAETGIYSDFYLTPVTEVSLDRTEVTLKKYGRKTQLRATVLPLDATYPDIYWTTSDPTVATVNAQGLVAPKREGTAIITAISRNTGLKATCNIAVSPKE